MQNILKFFTTRSLPLPLLAVLCWRLALPQFSFWLLVFIAPAIWTIIIRLPQLPGKHPYFAIWFASFLFWLSSIYWFAYPHPILILGLVAGAAYLSLYVPLFIALCRHAVFNRSVKPVFIVPIIWCGTEFIRKHLLGGFSLSSLEHALYKQPYLIGIADISGEYLVGMMIMLVGAALACVVPIDYPDSMKYPPRNGYIGRRVWKRNYSFEPLFLAAVAVTVTIVYSVIGAKNTNSYLQQHLNERRVCVLQGNTKIQLLMTEEMANDTSNQFVELARQAAMEAALRPDLIVFPETVFAIPFVEYEDGFTLNSEAATNEEREYWRTLSETAREQVLRNNAELCNKEIIAAVKSIGVPTILGLSTARLVTRHGSNPLRLNSALLVDPESGLQSRYDKISLVMFGEYIPLSNLIPENFPLRSLCPEAVAGNEYVATPIPPLADSAMVKGKNRYAAINICFESTIPHFIRRQVVTLHNNGDEPMLLINISNDAWFPFTCEAEQHLATMVFRAVEHRKPLVTASNGGYAAVIDANGNIVTQGKRNNAESITQTCQLSEIHTFYTHWGDTLAWSSFFVLIMVTSSWIVEARRKRYNRSGE
ncbi:MAG: apolipoprotein N-acyltransferase [Planctomycetaceae bacterium]|jgi:apolipoprotein N-acyltransferase|nr:apolipoprotein N-acyltransferase [Planctomycetaceae bacterium]